jgi:hypothetical protein
MQEIVAKAKQNQMEYYPFQFPINANDDGSMLVFKKNPLSKEFQLAKGGMTLLLQHLYGHVDRQHAKSLYRTGDLKGFAAYINQCRKNQESAQLWRRDQTYLLAVNGDVIYGVCARYNPKPNIEVLEDIQANGLTPLIERWDIDHEAMNIYLAHKTEKGSEIGLLIRNGETGHVALSYRLYVAQGDYTFSTAHFGRRKHMSNLELVDDDLKEIYADIADIRFHDFVLDSPAGPFAELILKDEALEKLHELVTPYHSRIKKLYKLLGVLNSQRSVRGWKVVCTKALDMLYTSIMEEL